MLLLVPAPDTFTATRYNQQISIQISEGPLLLEEVLKVGTHGCISANATGWSVATLTLCLQHLLPGRTAGSTFDHWLFNTSLLPLPMTVRSLCK